MPGSARLCGGEPAEPVDLGGIEEDVRPTAEQRALFDELNAAEAKAVDRLAAACPGSIPPTPTGRLDAMAQRFDAMLNAVRLVRPPLAAFYGALNDEQKARLLAGSAERRDWASRWLARCKDAPRAWASAPMDGIARALDLGGPQLAALDDFSRASDAAADIVRGSCPSEISLTPTGRLAAIEARLAALGTDGSRGARNLRK